MVTLTEYKAGQVQTKQVEPKDDKKNTIDVYSKHNKEVIEYFENRPNDLLVLDFTKGDSWEKICPFLNKEIPKLNSNNGIIV